MPLPRPTHSTAVRFAIVINLLLCLAALAVFSGRAPLNVLIHADAAAATCSASLWSFGNHTFGPAGGTTYIMVSTLQDCQVQGKASDWIRADAPVWDAAVRAYRINFTVLPNTTSSDRVGGMSWTNPDGTPGGSGVVVRQSRCAPPRIYQAYEFSKVSGSNSYRLRVYVNGKGWYDGTNNGTFTYRWYEGAKGDTSKPLKTTTDTNSFSDEFITPDISTTKTYWVRVTNLCGQSDGEAITLPPPERECTGSVRTSVQSRTTFRGVGGGSTVEDSSTPEFLTLLAPCKSLRDYHAEFDMPRDVNPEDAGGFIPQGVHYFEDSRGAVRPGLLSVKSFVSVDDPALGFGIDPNTGEPNVRRADNNEFTAQSSGVLLINDLTFSGNDPSATTVGAGLNLVLTGQMKAVPPKNNLDFSLSGMAASRSRVDLKVSVLRNGSQVASLVGTATLTRTAKTAPSPSDFVTSGILSPLGNGAGNGTYNLQVPLGNLPTGVPLALKIEFAAEAYSNYNRPVNSSSATADFTDGLSFPAGGNPVFNLPLGFTANAPTGLIGGNRFPVNCDAPSITTQPTSQTVSSGQTATLSVAAAGMAPLTYQWFKGNKGDTSNPVGTNSSVFTTPALSDTASYWVRVINSCGVIDSEAATVKVVGNCSVEVVSPSGPMTVLPGVSPSQVLPAGASNTTLDLKIFVKDASTRTVIPNPTLTFDYSAVERSGDHNHHDSGRPKGLFVPLGAQNDGSTLVTYGAPEVAGRIQFKVNATAPDGAKCSSDPNEIEVKVPLLVEFTDADFFGPTGAPFALVGRTDDHPLNHFATQQLRDALIKLAVEYNKKYGRLLTFNDMSLPWGGRFDICATAAAGCDSGVKPWANPHKGHMTGIHADVRIRNDKPDGYPGLPRDAKIRLDLIKMADALNLGVLIEGSPPHWHFIYGKRGCEIYGKPGVACDERTVLQPASSPRERTTASAPSVSVRATAQVTQDANTGLFTYRYTFGNDAGSSAELNSVQVQVNNAAVFNIQAPGGWTGSAWQDGSAVDFTATEVTTPGGYTDDGNLVPSPFQIKPGQSLEGFSFQSYAPPAAVNFTAQAFKEIPLLDEESTATQPSMFDGSFTGTTQGPASSNTGGNNIDDAAFFVRQHYLDFLNREPDPPGFKFWTNQIGECGSDAICREVRRINVSAAYFLSIEFQQTGYLIYRLNKSSFGTAPRYTSFMIDTSNISQGVVVGSAGWEDKLESNKKAFVEAWVNRADFRSLYDGKTSAEYVDALIANTGAAFGQSERDALVNGLATGSESRATVLRRIAENDAFSKKEFNPAFVLMQYFGYLRRDPDSGPDRDLSGFNFWLAKLNQFGGNFIRAEMVKAFISSDEYRKRFGQ